MEGRREEEMVRRREARALAHVCSVHMWEQKEPKMNWVPSGPLPNAHHTTVHDPQSLCQAQNAVTISN